MTAATNMYCLLLTEKATGAKNAIVIGLTQAQFEDDAVLAAALREAAPTWGITGAFDWQDHPYIEPGLQRRVKVAIGADSEATMVARYAHTAYFAGCKTVEVDGMEYAYRISDDGMTVAWADVFVEDQAEEDHSDLPMSHQQKAALLREAAGIDVYESAGSPGQYGYTGCEADIFDTFEDAVDAAIYDNGLIGCWHDDRQAA